MLHDIFSEIYASGKWGRDQNGKGTSGPGSTLGATVEYRSFIEGMIKYHNVRSVLDAGCGDWGFSSAIDWQGVSYLGIDAANIVRDLQEKYVRPGVQFMGGDITDPLPAADLLLCKDVLQHLPNDLVCRFIKNNLRSRKYRYALITNDKGTGNPDILPGEHRALDLSASPFCVEGLIELPIRFYAVGGDLKKTQLIVFR
jgi:SAM-dependent methyltransferase